jgi:hypothetical protein
MLRQVTSQRHIGIEIKSHFALRLSGISVINFVIPDKCSVIQIVRTDRIIPLGPLNAPLIS